MTQADTETSSQWTFRAKCCASALIAMHLFAVFSAPWGSPPPSSGLAQRTGEFFHPYTQSLAIDNGYRYFAPNPEPSQIVRYTLTNADGTTTKGAFPDKQSQWPRLHYHRHLILADTVAKWVAAAPYLPPELLLGPDERAAYERQRERSQILLRSIANQLLAANSDAQSVEMVLHEHAIPTPDDILNGVKLTDEKLYDSSLPLGVFPREQP